MMLTAALLMTGLLQTPTPAIKVSAVLWEYSDALVSEAVFVVKVDDADPITLTPDTSRVERAADAPLGSSTYAYPLPALKVTTHRVTVQTCSSVDPEVCAPESAVEFRLIIAPVPVGGLRAK